MAEQDTPYPRVAFLVTALMTWVIDPDLIGKCDPAFKTEAL